MRLEEIEKELGEIREQIVPLLSRQTVLSRERETLLAAQWIAVNRVTKDDIQMSSGDDMPYISLLSQFVEWLKKQPSQKRFAEWNSVIYFTSDLLSGRLPEMPARISNLPVQSS